MVALLMRRCFMVPFLSSNCRHYTKSELDLEGIASAAVLKQTLTPVPSSFCQVKMLSTSVASCPPCSPSFRPVKRLGS